MTTTADPGTDTGWNVPEWTFADRLRKIRRSVGMSQDDFAQQVRLAAGTLKAWETGAVKPREADLILLAARCEILWRIPSWWVLGQADPDQAGHTTPMGVRLAPEELAIIRRLCATGDLNSEPAGPELPAGNDQLSPAPGNDHGPDGDTAGAAAWAVARTLAGRHANHDHPARGAGDHTSTRTPGPTDDQYLAGQLFAGLTSEVYS